MPRRFASLAGVLLLALVVRLIAHGQMAAADDTFAPLIDSEAYLLQALRVAAGEDIAEGVYFQAPLYPWVLGGVLWASGVPGVVGAERTSEVAPDVLADARRAGAVLHGLLGLLLVALVWRLGERLFSPGTGLAAGLLAAAYGPFLFYEGHLLKVSLALLFLPWAALACARAERLGRPGAYVWTGLALGLGGLVRGNMHLMGVLAVAALLVTGWRSRRAFAIRGAAAVLAGIVLAVAPVIVRNSVVAGHPVLSTAAGGTAFYLCNHAGNDTGLVEHVARNRQVPRYELDDWKQLAEDAVGTELTHAEISSYWFGRAWDDIRADPARWMLVEARKLGLAVSRYEAPDNTLVLMGERACPLLAATPARYSVIVPLAFGGAALAWLMRRRGEWHPGRIALALALLGYVATLLLFNMTSRFRQPVAPLAIVYAGLLLAETLRIAASRWRGRESLPGAGRRLGLAGVAVVAGWAASLASEGPLGPLDRGELASHLAVRYANRSQLALARGDIVAARADLERALEEGRAGGKVSPSLLYQRAALARAASWNAPRDEAIPLRAAARTDIDAALEINPRFGPAWRLAGLLEYDSGRNAEATTLFETALALVPLDREARQYLTLSLLAEDRASEARTHAQLLWDQRPDHDDGPGLLALACAEAGDVAAAISALEAYDRLASMREAAGLPRRLPDQPAFAALRTEP